MSLSGLSSEPKSTVSLLNYICKCDNQLRDKCEETKLQLMTTVVRCLHMSVCSVKHFTTKSVCKFDGTF